jgi:hypothetical protein
MKATIWERQEVPHYAVGFALWAMLMGGQSLKAADPQDWIKEYTQDIETEQKLLDMFRAFQYPRWPYVLPPGTPPATVKILRTAMASALKDPGFSAEFKKLMGGEPSPLTGEEVETSIRELPRDPEVIGLYKKMAEHGPLPPR